MRETYLCVSVTTWRGFGAYRIQLPLSFQFFIITSKSKAILQLLVLLWQKKGRKLSIPLRASQKDTNRSTFTVAVRNVLSEQRSTTISEKLFW